MCERVSKSLNYFIKNVGFALLYNKKLFQDIQYIYAVYYI